VNLTAFNFPDNVVFFSTPKRVEAGCSRGNYDNFNLATHTYDNPKCVADNRKLLIKKFNLPSAPNWLTQTHSDICISASSTPRKTPCVADAIVTHQKGVVCAVLTADCLPIFACSAKGTKVGVAHAGWRGLANGVVEAFIHCFGKETVMVHLGACISQQTFEVGQEVYQAFIDKDTDLAHAFIGNNDKYQLDMHHAARIILTKLGVEYISNNNDCTFTQSDDYFSYRREGAKSGRNAHLIWLK
jgi:YfiH family protein